MKIDGGFKVARHCVYWPAAAARSWRSHYIQAGPAELAMASVPSPLITSHPDRLGGSAVFTGTRVPVHTLIEYLEAGHPLDQFLDDYPSVTRDHAVAVLELAKQALITPAA